MANQTPKLPWYTRLLSAVCNAIAAAIGANKAT
jgi:hypothetical protein